MTDETAAKIVTLGQMLNLSSSMEARVQFTATVLQMLDDLETESYNKGFDDGLKAKDRNG